jgi:hypothetical protein
MKPLEQKQNELIELEENDYDEIEIDDEFDKSELAKVFDENNRVAVFGALPGTGKTTSVANYKHKTLFISQFNKQCQELRKKRKFYAITLHKLLNMGIDGKSHSKGKQFNIQSFYSICFDELALYNVEMLELINTYMNKHPEIKFMATLDLDQNEPIGSESLNDVTDKRAYILNCIYQMFPTYFTLKICKRFKNESDQRRLFEIKKDILNVKIPIMDTIKKYGFKTIHRYDQIKSLVNICYFNVKLYIMFFVFLH